MPPSRPRLGWLLCAPALVLLAATVIAPLALTAATAHPTALIGNRAFAHSVRVSLAYAVCSVALQLAVGTLFGLALARLAAHRASTTPPAAGGLALLPWLVPGVVAALAWAFLFERPPGARGATGWLANPAVTWAAWGAADVWRHAPLVALFVCAAALRRDRRLGEAALLDGAARRDVFRSVTLPAFAPALSLALLFIAPRALVSFDVPFVLGRGGPDGATSTLSLLARARLTQGFGPEGAGIAAVALALSTALGAVLWRATTGRRRGRG